MRYHQYLPIAILGGLLTPMMLGGNVNLFLFALFGAALVALILSVYNLWISEKTITLWFVSIYSILIALTVIWLAYKYQYILSADQIATWEIFASLGLLSTSIALLASNFKKEKRHTKSIN